MNGSYQIKRACGLLMEEGGKPCIETRKRRIPWCDGQLEKRTVEPSSFIQLLFVARYQRGRRYDPLVRSVGLSVVRGVGKKLGAVWRNGCAAVQALLKSEPGGTCAPHSAVAPEDLYSVI